MFCIIKPFCIFILGKEDSHLHIIHYTVNGDIFEFIHNVHFLFLHNVLNNVKTKHCAKENYNNLGKKNNIVKHAMKTNP